MYLDIGVYFGEFFEYEFIVVFHTDNIYGRGAN